MGHILLLPFSSLSESVVAPSGQEQYMPKGALWATSEAAGQTQQKAIYREESKS